MHFDTEFLKRNWYYFAAAIVGVIVIYELAKAAGGSASSSAAGSDTTGFVNASGGPVSQLQAGADIAASNNNAQIQTANFGAQVADNQIAAQLTLGQTQTAAQLAESLATTAASRDVAIHLSNNDVQKTALQVQGAVDVQSIVTGGQVQQTAIVGRTLDTLAATQADVQKTMIATVGSQITQIQDHSKHASQDYTAFAPIAAIELGEQGAASSTAAANSKSRTAGSAVESTAITTGGGIINSFVKGLLG